MKRLIKIALIILTLVCFTGCIDVNTAVKVKPDGSGTIEETVLFSKGMVEQMKAMMEEMSKAMEQPGEESKDKTTKKDEKNHFDIFDEPRLKENASKMGEGVKYISGKKVTTDKGEGYKAVYSFADINKIKIDQNPESGKSISQTPQAGDDSKSLDDKKEYIKFQFTKGKTSTLIIKLPSQDKTKTKDEKIPDKEANTPPLSKEAEEIASAQMKKMFEGLKVAMVVDVQGTIIETNAEYRQDSRITLMEMDFGKLIESKDKFEKFKQSNPETLEEAKKIIKDIPGIKVDLNKEIKVIFKAADR